MLKNKEMILKDYCFDFSVHDQHHQQIQIEVFDKDTTDKDDLLGDARISLTELVSQESSSGKALEKWFPLK